MHVSNLRLKLTAVTAGLLLPAAALLGADGASTRSAAPAPVTPPAASASSASAAVATPVELPAFRFGLWEYQRTLMQDATPKPRVTSMKKCVDPGEEMRAKMDTLKKRGCEFAPVKRHNDRYISSWVCQTQTGPLRFRDVLIVKDENGYQDVSETHSPQGVSQQKITATRLGDCPGMGSGAPLLPTPKLPDHSTPKSPTE